MMGRSATFFFAGYEGGPGGLHGVPSQPALRTHRSSILRAAVAPNLRCECRFPGHERERPCGHNAALSSLSCHRACSTAPCPRRRLHGAGLATPTNSNTHVTDFSTLECSELKNCIDNQENQSLNSFRLCPVYVDDDLYIFIKKRGPKLCIVCILFFDLTVFVHDSQNKKVGQSESVFAFFCTVVHPD